MDGVDWGSVPDWLAGLGAITALVFAGAAVRGTRKQIAALQRNDDDRIAAEKRRYAEGLAVWLTRIEANDARPGAARFLGTSDRLPAVGLTNAAGVPFYDATVHVGGPAGVRSETYNYITPEGANQLLGRATRVLQGLYQDGGEQDFHNGRLWVAIAFPRSPKPVVVSRSAGCSPAR